MCVLLIFYDLTGMLSEQSSQNCHMGMICIVVCCCVLLMLQVSALVTCERAVSIFYGWGHPVAFHARALSGMKDRSVEARDAARSALGNPP